MFLQILAAFLGSLGFALLFQLKKEHLLPASLGGMLSWALYLILSSFHGQVFYVILLVSALASVYAECIAKLRKAPAILFRIPALVPLIPGSSLYYTMNALVQNNWNEAANYGLLTLQWALGISAGASIIAIIQKMWRSAALHRKRSSE